MGQDNDFASGAGFTQVLRDGPILAWFLVDPVTGCKRVETNVACLLHIPLVLFEGIQKGGRPLMPHNVLAIVLKHIENGPTDQAQAVADAWQLVAMWCVMVAQADQQGESLVLFSVNAITEGGDAYIGQRVENHLDSTSLARAGAICSRTLQRGGYRPSRTGPIQNTIDGTREGGEAKANRGMGKRTLRP